jgi:glycosyltransferase involved in cell wall biosynthesis
MINQADAGVTISKFLRELFRQRGVKTEPFPVIPPGVDRDLFHPPRSVSTTESKTVLFIGRMVRSKGIFDLIDAFDLLLDLVDSPVELTFVGDGTDRKEAIEVVKDKRLEEYVSFYGHVNHSEVADFVRQSDVVVLPSWYEALGNTVVEAQSCEVPVVGCRVGGIPELLSDGRGILVEPHNPRELAEAIQCIFSNDELAQELAINGREFVENHHALDVVRDDYVSLLKRVVSRTIS